MASPASSCSMRCRWLVSSSRMASCPSCETLISLSTFWMNRFTPSVSNCCSASRCSAPYLNLHACTRGRRLPAKEREGGARDGIGVDAVVAVEVGACPRLAEVVHAERLLGDSERAAEEGEAVRVAVLDRNDRHAFLVGRDQLLEVRPRLPETAEEAVRAGHDGDARGEAGPAQGAGGFHHPREPCAP